MERIAFVLSFVFCVGGTHLLASGTPQFRKMAFPIEGLPAGYWVTAWTLGDMTTRGRPDLIVAGTTDSHEASSVLFQINLKTGRLIVTNKLLDRPTPGSGSSDVTLPYTALFCVDLYKDGRREVFAMHDDPKYQCMIESVNGKVIVKPVPFPRLHHPVLAWLDYDGDGWVDLFLSGLRTREPGPVLEPVKAKLYRNRRGQLEETSIAFSVPEGLDSVHVIDLNHDRRPDLLLGVNTFSNGVPRYNRIFLNTDNTFREIDLPLNLNDKLDGLSGANIAFADFTGDGLPDLLVSGMLAEQLGPKTYVAIMYRTLFYAREKKYFFRYDSHLLGQIPDMLSHYYVGDYAGDGRKCIFVYGVDRFSKSRVGIFENRNGAFTFVPGGAWNNDNAQPFGPNYRGMIVPIDVNEDGLMDFLCFNVDGQTTPVLLLNVSR